MATDQQFCLRWNNHQSTLISVFDSLLENGTLVDCTLAAEGQYLKAHKVVLSACSPYLETLLSQHYEKHPIVILKDVKFSELKSMMDYMYRGEVNISQDQLGTFLKAAESLQIKGLSDNGEDARDVGSTAKKPDAPRPSVTQTRAALESKRPAPLGDLSDTSRDGSISPSSLRKRRRTRRPSQGDDPDSNLDNNVCDLPAAQSTPMPVPSAAPVQSLPKQIVKTEPPPPMPDPVKKEILDPPAEPLLEPKTEYLDYMNNENSIEVEDLTLDDDDEEGLDSSMDASRPGPSHGDLSQQGGYPPWTMTGDQSGTDEIFMAAQEAVGAATGQQQRDSQGDDVSRNSLESVFIISSLHQMSNEFYSELNPLEADSPSPSAVCLGKETKELKKVNTKSGSESKCFFRINRNQSCPPKMLSVKDRIKQFQNKPERMKIESVSKRGENKSMFGRKRRKLVWSGDGFGVKSESGKDEVETSSNCEKKQKPVATTSKEQSSNCFNVSERKNMKNKYLHYPFVKRNSTGSKSVQSGSDTAKSDMLNKRVSCQIKKTYVDPTHTKGEYRCNKCGRVYMYKRGLRHHQKYACDSKKQFGCAFCDDKFNYRASLKSHMNHMHQEEVATMYELAI